MRKIYKLSGLKWDEANLVVDAPIKEFGIRRKMELARQLYELTADVELGEERLDETKVTGKG